MFKIQRIQSKIKHFFSWHQKTCPFCGAYFDEYLETGTDALVWKKLHGVGAGKRKAICPNCGSSDRERLVYLFFRDYFFPKINNKKISMFHVAPESNLSSFFRSKEEIKYYAGDKRCEGYTYPDDVIDLDVMDLSVFENNTFDIIVCNHVLEHVTDDILAMSELHRVLKKNGFAVLQVPYALKLNKTIENPSVTTSEARFNFYGQSDHLRLYGIDYTERLARAGFTVEVLNITNRYSKKMGLNTDERLFICHKI